MNLKASIRINGIRTNDVLQVNEWFVIIGTNHKDLEVAVNDLTNEVKDVVTTLYAKMSDMVALVKVLMMAMRKSSQ